MTNSALSMIINNKKTKEDNINEVVNNLIKNAPEDPNTREIYEKNITNDNIVKSSLLLNNKELNDDLENNTIMGILFFEGNKQTIIEAPNKDKLIYLINNCDKIVDFYWNFPRIDLSMRKVEDVVNNMNFLEKIIYRKKIKIIKKYSKIIKELEEHI